jgi:hypothetical protein
MLFYFAGELTKSKSKISQHAEQVRDIMLAVKGSTVKSGLLHLTTDLQPSAMKTCKWTEKASTTSCFVNLFDDLTELTEHDDSKVVFNTSRQFKSKSIQFSQQWDAFASLHDLLQEDGLACNKGQKLIDTLHNTIEANREKQGRPFKDCELGNEHSKFGNKHETDHFFLSGVDKIHNENETQLVPKEKTACKSLLKRNHLSWTGGYDNDDYDDFSDDEELLLTQESAYSMRSIFSQESKKAEVEEQKRESNYIYCLFIGSSAGIVERLWSKFDALADQRCSGMSPVMIEAILYLKENCDLWSIDDIPVALKKLKNNEKTARFEARMAALNQEQTQIVANMETFDLRDD